MFYAKSSPQETIRSHTDRLLENYELIKKYYQPKYVYMNKRSWQLLKMAINYHDIGKVYPRFQNILLQAMGLTKLDTETEYNLPHNFISIVLIPYKDLGLLEQEKRLLAHIVGYHHERDIVLNADLKHKIMDAVNKDIIKHIDLLAKHMQLPITKEPVSNVLDQLRMRYNPGITLEQNNEFYEYVMLKGLLHRIDHSASAGVPAEQCPDENIGEYVRCFFIRTHKKPRPLQVFAESNRENHLIAVAQTGMGKTEAALLWIGEDKGFFTLPLRVSINSMYNRINDNEEIGFPVTNGALGLLHASSLDYLEHGRDDGLDWESYNNASRQFSNKLLITTVDQILKFPFFYRGFEKELASIAGNRIVIDELQAYDPKIAALIIRALEMIDKIGGKFMIMTATMPKIYLDYILNEAKIERNAIKHETFINDDLQRHRIKIINEPIIDYIDEISLHANKKKVLVICNTVNRAVNVYSRLLHEGVKVNLLHALFVQKHRSALEYSINKFSRYGTAGVWVTTQLVEASLNIDFDILFTEMSALDSLFQRMGRCYRQRNLDHHKANIYVFTEDASGIGTVYHKDIHQRSNSLLADYNGDILLESDKIALIEKLYDKEALKDSAFMKDFEQSLRFFEDNTPYDITIHEAQQYLRDIHQVKVIPRDLFDQISHLLEQYQTEKDKGKRRKLRRDIEQYSVSVNKCRARDKVSFHELPRTLRDLAIIDLPYHFTIDKKIGLDMSAALSNFT